MNVSLVLCNPSFCSITQREIAAYAQKMQETKGSSLVHRICNMVSRIFRYAIASGICEWNPAVHVGEALSPYRVALHRSTVQAEGQARVLMKDIDGYDKNPVIRIGLLLLAHTFVRPGELRFAQWSEIDFEKQEWRIPAERMKMRREHAVPLSPQSVSLFLELRDMGFHEMYCFVLPCKDSPIAINSFSRAMISLGYGSGKATPHSFRGMASTLLNEHGFSSDVIERQLAHAETNTVRAAYNRAEYMDERRKMMNWWSDYLDSLIK